VTLWKDRPVDDGAVQTSETALRPVADAVVSHAVRALRRAFREGNVAQQWHAQLVLELATVLRGDLRSGTWCLLDPRERRSLRQALLMLGVLVQTFAPIPVA
jgi:hypothetical protein